MDSDSRVLIDREGVRLAIARRAPGEDDAPDAEAAATVDWGGAPLLARYAWRWWGASGSVTGDRWQVVADGAECHAAWGDADGQALLRLRRRIRVRRGGWSDEVEFVNPGAARAALTIEFDAAAADPVADGLVAPSDLRLATRTGVVAVAFDALAAARPDGADWELSLAPGERVALRADVSLRPG